jgi:hypothetical protein
MVLPRPTMRVLQFLRPRLITPRLPPNARKSSSAPSGSAPKASRVSRILSRLPRPLQKYTSGLRNAPLSHVVAFLILHEITAVIPLIGLFGLFHYTQFTPVRYVTEHWGPYVQDGVTKFEKYFKRKGWFGFEPDSEAKGASRELSSVDAQQEITRTNAMVVDWENAEGKYKVLADVALAWALTKAILPARILASVWATPWFAGLLARGRALLRR